MYTDTLFVIKFKDQHVFKSELQYVGTIVLKKTASADLIFSSVRTFLITLKPFRIHSIVCVCFMLTSDCLGNNTVNLSEH
jgi:hypothetical protein